MERLTYERKSGTSSNTQIEGNTGIKQAKLSKNLEEACISLNEDDQSQPTTIDNTDEEDETREAAVNTPFLTVVPTEMKATS